MRVFAGPNGSGKTTIINEVRNTKVNNQPIDFGIYVNADDIAQELRNGNLNFSKFKITVTDEELKKESIASGLINNNFTEEQFTSCFSFRDNGIILNQVNDILKPDERIAQILAHFLRKKLLKERKKFSFETVFSHRSKLDIMREAKEMGYKVYLYFVSTESPEINKYRVDTRVRSGGHYVDPQKIEQRYYRALDLLYDAVQLCYQAYFFDNSKDLKEGETTNWFGHFKLIGDKKNWDELDPSKVPTWFLNYYSTKVTSSSAK